MKRPLELMVIPSQIKDRFVHFCCIYGATKVHQLFHNNVKGYKSNDIIVSTLIYQALICFILYTTLTACTTENRVSLKNFVQF